MAVLWENSHERVFFVDVMDDFVDFSTFNWQAAQNENISKLLSVS